MVTPSLVLFVLTTRLLQQMPHLPNGLCILSGTDKAAHNVWVQQLLKALVIPTYALQSGFSQDV